MDPELLVLAPVAAALAILGARRRAAQANGRTPGQQLEQATTSASRRVGEVVGGVIETPATAAAGAVQSTHAPGSGAAGGIVGTLGRAGGAVARVAADVTGRATARPTGLLVDGGAAVVDFFGSVPSHLFGPERNARPAPRKATRSRSKAKKQA